MSEKTFRERILDTFQRNKVDKIVWQPRLDYYINVNRARGTLPEKYRDKNIIEIHRDLNASIRYYWGLPIPQNYLIRRYRDTIKITEIKNGDETTVVYDTSKGQLISRIRTTEFGCSSHIVEYPVKKIDDLDIIEYMLQNSVVEFNYEFYETARQDLTDLGEIQMGIGHSPLQSLIIDYMGFENTIYALTDSPERINRFLNEVDELQDETFEIIEKCPVKIINFGENIDSNLISPDIFKKYLIPYYIKRVSQLQKRGKFCHIHMDGKLKPLLPYIRETGFDGIEAATPFPQGDIALEELKSAIGNMILLDGIPAILFLPNYPLSELENCVQKILDLFSPNLILGISDELPPDADIDRVKFISELIDNKTKTKYEENIAC